MSRPGDRFGRWQTSHRISAGIYFFFAAFVVIGVDGWGKLIAVPMLFMMVLDIVDSKRGWQMRNDIPLHARRMAKRPGLTGRYARETIETLEKRHER